MRKFYDVEEKVPLSEGIPLSLQHLFAMFGSTVLVPFLLHVNPATAIFMNGIGTILYLIICRGRLPAYLGSSFAFISPILAVISTAGLTYSDAQGGFIAFGFAFIILSFIIKKIGTKWIDLILPPAAMGAVVSVIGLELAPMALTMSGFIVDPNGNSAIPSQSAMFVSSMTLIITILASVLGRGFIGIIPVLIGVVCGYIISFFVGIVDWSGVVSAPWFSIPTFYEPHFNFSAIMMILPALFVVFAEHVGHLVVTGSIVHRNLIENPGLHRSLFADGLSNIISGLVGSTPNTTYGENMGVMAITHVYSVWVIGGAAVFAIMFSFIGKVAAIIHAIPVPVMGGVSILLFGIIACSGIRMLIEKKVDYTKSKNMILTAVTMISGLSGTVFILGPVQLKGMGLATVTAMIISIAFAIFEKLNIDNKN